MGLAFACLLGACLEADVVSCADSRVCPSGSRCDDERNRCVSPEQQVACNGLADAAPCVISGAAGTCRAGTCDPLICGDGMRTGTESCDGADLGDASCMSLGFYSETTGLRCADDCRFDTSGCSGACGDGILNGNEQCDSADLGTADCRSAGFYDGPGLKCSPFCIWDVSSCTGKCGDGEINGGELCDGVAPADTCVDLGFDAGPLQCSLACSAGFATCARFGWRSEAAPVVAFAVSATGRTNQWAVGDVGGAAHSTGGPWTAVSTGVANPLVAVWSLAETDVWAIGIGVGASDPSVVLHRDAMGFQVVQDVPAASYADVWAASASAVFIATADLGVLAWNGTTWQDLGGLTGVPLVAIRGTSPTDIWVAGVDGSVRHWNGSAWAVSPFPGFASQLVAIAPDDVWAIGSPDPQRFQGLAAHWNGTAWTPFVDATHSWITIAASAHNDAWVGDNIGDVFHFDGLGWFDAGKITPSGDLSAPLLVSLDAGDVSGVSFSGVAYQFHGQAYVKLDPGPAAAGNKQTISSDLTGNIFVGDNLGNVGHYDGIKWTSLPKPGFVARTLWSDGPSDAFAGGTSGQVFRWNGTAWSDTSSPSALNIDVIWGVAADDVWAFGAAGANHFDGQGWSASLMPGPVTTASGSSSNNVYAVRGGSSPQELWRWNGTTFQLVTTQALHIYEIAVTGPDDVFAVSDNRVLHWDGTTWSVQDVTPIDPRQIAATAHDDVIAASATAMLHFDGSVWSPIRPPLNDVTNSIVNLGITPTRIDVLYTRSLRSLSRVRPWVCRASETRCGDNLDEDCDGKLDGYDPDCP